jgi:membrane-anchored protein YejM (alkaline phosphatase superfamily)
MKCIAQMSASLLLPGKNFLRQVSVPQCQSGHMYLTLSFIGDNFCVFFFYICKSVTQTMPSALLTGLP